GPDPPILHPQLGRCRHARAVRRGPAHDRARLRAGDHPRGRGNDRPRFAGPLGRLVLARSGPSGASRHRRHHGAPGRSRLGPRPRSLHPGQHRRRRGRRVPGRARGTPLQGHRRGRADAHAAADEHRALGPDQPALVRAREHRAVRPRVWRGRLPPRERPPRPAARAAQPARPDPDRAGGLASGVPPRHEPAEPVRARGTDLVPRLRPRGAHLRTRGLGARPAARGAPGRRGHGPDPRTRAARRGPGGARLPDRLARRRRPTRVPSRSLRARPLAAPARTPHPAAPRAAGAGGRPGRVLRRARV
ncbi:MAG: hypothetical protein AVDCRST_MAG04-2814, partial [uncultured Acetobacteraceae bacterium]